MSSGQIVVRRVGELHGTIDVPGAKNAVLKLMAATILADGTYELTNVPTIVDVTIMGELLDAIGIRTEVPEPGRLRMTNTGDLTPVAPYELVERIRASINVLGPLLTRCGRVRLSMPGGDDFGARPIDMHIAGLEAMGADVQVQPRRAGGDRRPPARRRRHVRVPERRGDGEHRHRGGLRRRRDDDRQRRPGAGGRRPVRDAAWRWAPTSRASARRRLVVRGVEPGSLHPVDHRTVPDRIQAATYLAAVAVAGGELHIRDARPEHMQNLLGRFADMGLDVELGADLRVAAPRPAALDRRADPAVPGHRHRLQAAVHHHAERSPTASASSPRTSTRVASATSRS